MKLLLALLPAALCLDNGVGLKPAMGWNRSGGSLHIYLRVLPDFWAFCGSWNVFKARLSADVVKQTADLLVSTGLAAKGYTYVNMDDTWAAGRDSTGVLLPDAARVPSGIRALSDYCHSKKLFFCIYTDVGHQTFCNKPVTWGFEELDAATFANWTW